MKLQEVKAIAKGRRVDPGRMRKDELIKAIQVPKAIMTVLEPHRCQDAHSFIVSEEKIAADSFFAAGERIA